MKQVPNNLQTFVERTHKQIHAGKNSYKIILAGVPRVFFNETFGKVSTTTSEEDFF